MRKTALVTGGLACGLVIAIFIIFNSSERRREDEREYEKKIEGLMRKLTVVSGARSTLQRALGKSLKKKAHYKELLEDERKRKEVLDFEAQGLRARNLALKSEIGRLEQERTELNGRLASFKKLREGLESKIRRLLLMPKVELGAVVIKPAGLNGKILKANSAYNFVIIDLGRNDGVKSGMTLLAYKQDNPIGEITIEKVYDELSVGRALFEWREDEVAVGDAVRGRQ